jgi:hypothetical protein
MAVNELFSKRQARLRGDVPEFFQYSTLPDALRAQIIYILADLLHGGIDEDPNRFSGTRDAYQNIRKTLLREWGVYDLNSETPRGNHVSSQLWSLVRHSKDLRRCLDVVELAVRYADINTRHFEYMLEPDPNERVESGIKELNQRFIEHGVGYQYADGILVQMNSDFLHAEVVVPSLRLLRSGGHSGAEEEFMRAHEHFRAGRIEESITEACKAFESTMKCILSERGVAEVNLTAKKLISLCLTNGVIERTWQSLFENLQGLLETGTLMARNKFGAHGRGTQETRIPFEVGAYALHMTASSIVFLVECSRRQLPPVEAPQPSPPK